MTLSTVIIITLNLIFIGLAIATIRERKEIEAVHAEINKVMAKLMQEMKND